jgi:hypothetical protein
VQRREEKCGRVRNELGFTSLRVSPGFVRPRIARGYQIEANGCHRLGHGAAQMGMNLSQPSPRTGPGARGRTMCEQATGHHSILFRTVFCERFSFSVEILRLSGGVNPSPRSWTGARDALRVSKPCASFSYMGRILCNARLSEGFVFLISSFTM